MRLNIRCDKCKQKLIVFVSDDSTYLNLVCPHRLTGQGHSVFKVKIDCLCYEPDVQLDMFETVKKEKMK